MDIMLHVCSGLGNTTMTCFICNDWNGARAQFGQHLQEKHGVTNPVKVHTSATPRIWKNTIEPGNWTGSIWQPIVYFRSWEMTNRLYLFWVYAKNKILKAGMWSFDEAEPVKISLTAPS